MRTPKKFKAVLNNRPLWAVLNYGRLMAVRHTRKAAIEEVFGPVIEGEWHGWPEFISNPANEIVRVDIRRRPTQRKERKA